MESVQSLIAFSLLIVEDDKTAREVIARMIPIKFPNCTIYSADNGIQGLELFKECVPDLVVTDINMPVMEGFEMIRKISSLAAGVSVIVLTAYADKITFDKFKDLDVCTYLLKPLDFDELFSAIERCLDKTEPQGI